MIRKPFKPPGSKDGESTSSLSKPFVKPIVKSAIVASKPITEVKKDEQSVKVETITKNPSNESESIQNEQKPAVVQAPKPLGLGGLKGKPFRPVSSQKQDDTSKPGNDQKSATTTAGSAQNNVKTSTNPQESEKVVAEEYYKCFWSKDVRKKHKVLDDGIIIFQGNKIQIFNSDGGKVYDSYKSKLYCPNPDNADQYIVGSIFVEQDAAIKKDDFLSGRCFVKAKMTFDKDQLDKKKKQAQPFKMKPKEGGPKPQDIEVPEKAYLITDPNNPELFPVYVDSYLNDNMRLHQRQGVKFMFECIAGLRGPDIGGCILADSMGLGKTLQTIALIWTLIRRNPFSSTAPLLKKVVVVAPVSLLGSWKKEVKKWLGDARLIPKIAIGKREAVIQACKDFAMSSSKMLLISYEQFRMHVETLSTCCDLLIFDEGHRLKNMNIKTFKSFNSIKCNKRIILTGTPLQNSLDEFYSCVKFVNPNIFENEKQFKFVFSDPIVAALKSDATQQMVEKASIRSKELTHIISRFVIRRKADILEKLLPPRSEYFVFLKMTPLQTMLYKKMIQARFTKNEFDTENGAFSLLTIMRKVLNHPQLIYTDQTNTSSQEFKQYFPADFQLNDWDASLKFKFVSDILDKMKEIEKREKSMERIIIVSYWTQTLDVIQNMVKEKDLKYVRLDGSVNAQKRQELIDRFQDPTTDLRVFMLCGKAGGTGLNLSAANRMILFEVDWNPSNDLQVMGRIWRDGQTKPVHIYRLVSCGTMEEKVLQRQFLKEDLSQNVVDEKMIVKQYNNDTLKQLFQFKGDDQCLTFKEEDNTLDQLKNYTPDYVPGMEDYITFLKRTIKGEKKDQPDDNQEAPPENEFDQGNIFLKPEAEENEEEDEPSDNLDEEEEEKILEEIEKEAAQEEPSTVRTISNDNDEENDINKKDESENEFDGFNKNKNTKNNEMTEESPIEDKESNINKTEDQEQVEEQKEEQIEQKQDEQEEEQVVTKGKRGRRKATPATETTNPAKNILKKLKK